MTNGGGGRAAIAAVALWVVAACSGGAEAPSTAPPPSTEAEEPAPHADRAPPTAPHAPELRAAQRAGDTSYVLLPGTPGATTGEAHRLGEHDSWSALASPPAGIEGRAVRIVADEGECDGTLGAPVRLDHTVAGAEYVEHALAAPVAACSAMLHPQIAVLDPAPSTIASMDTNDAVAQRAIAAAREAARVSDELAWAPDRAWRAGGAVYALAQQEPCEDEGCLAQRGAIARVVGDAAPEVVMLRPPQLPWEGREGVWFSFAALTDWNGDGTVELVEDLGCSVGAMTRLVSPSADASAGEIVWTARFTEASSMRPTITPTAP